MNIIQQLNKIIQERHLLRHDFYQAWSAGKLSISTLQHYAAQYYKQVESFPRFVSRVHTYCPHLPARKVLLSNLLDEELHGTDHPTLWLQFAHGLGLTTESVQSVAALPETQALVDTYYELADTDWRSGLCALFAYESQVPAISTEKIAGLQHYYGLNDEATLAFFTEHQHYDVEHAHQVAGLITQYVENTDQAVRATQTAVDALWGFLDGMCRVMKDQNTAAPDVVLC